MTPQHIFYVLIVLTAISYVLMEHSTAKKKHKKAVEDAEYEAWKKERGL